MTRLSKPGHEGTYWCCAADFGEHEKDCPNYQEKPMNPRITIQDNWDGTQSVLLDGEVVFDRKPHEACREKANYLDTLLAVEGLPKITVDNQ